MNILFVTGTFAKKNASISGMPNYIYKTATALKQREHNVYILTADDESHRWKYKGIPVYSVKVFPSITRFAWIAFGAHNLMRDFSLQKYLKDLVLELKIDIIQYAGWFGVGLLHSRRIGIPAVMRMSSYAKVQLISVYTDKQINVISKMERLACRNMDGVFAPSKVIADAFAKDINREVKVIETPFQLEISETDWDYLVYDENLKEKKYFLYFGRLTPDKGILTIARSLYRILNEHKDIFFVFAGELYNIGKKSILDILHDYGQEHSKRIVYLGALRKEQLYPIINNAYSVLIPSLMDNLPNSCMEAMYLQKVVVGTKGTSLDQLIKEDVSGMLIEPDNEKMLIDKLNELLEMPSEMRKRMGESAHERIVMMRPEILIRELEEYYISIQNSYMGTKNKS